MRTKKGIFQRTELLFGREKMDEIAGKRVIILGIGGVGSWCAESLIRSGIHHLTIVDSDRVCITNINRQLHATMQTVGEVKTDALKKRLLEINPDAEITAIQKIYSVANHELFDLDSYDYIIDAIDSLGSKVHLIRMATKCHGELFSSMGASLKLDPTQIRVAEFWKVQGQHSTGQPRHLGRAVKQADEGGHHAVGMQQHTPDHTHHDDGREHRQKEDGLEPELATECLVEQHG